MIPPTLIQGDLSSFGPDSEEQQKRVLSVADRDGFNWGYDPVHYGVPEGSYASNPNGWSRVLEFRKMVQGLHRLGLGVVLDVVYNHTFHSGLDGEQQRLEMQSVQDRRCISTAPHCWLLCFLLELMSPRLCLKLRLKKQQIMIISDNSVYLSQEAC